MASIAQHGLAALALAGVILGSTACAAGTTARPALAAQGTPSVTTGTHTANGGVTVTPMISTAVAQAPLSATATITSTGATTSMTSTSAITAASGVGGWSIRAVDTMKLSRDTRKDPLNDAQIAAVVRLDARLHLTHIAVDVYYDSPAYMARWVHAVRAAALHVWFRAHWYAWENHRDRRGTMTPREYVDETRSFLQENIGLLRDGDIFDFCSEPENGTYWTKTYGSGWSWRSNEAAKHDFNTFVRSGVYMASTTLAHRGLKKVLVTAISVNDSVAMRLLSKPTVKRLGLLTLDLYPEGKTRDPSTAARLLISDIAAVHRRWAVPILLGEHGYARDIAVDDATQARVLEAELSALAQLPYLRGLNYWVDAGGRGYGGYTNLYRKAGPTWQPRLAAQVLARAFGNAR